MRLLAILVVLCLLGGAACLSTPPSAPGSPPDGPAEPPDAVPDMAPDDPTDDMRCVGSTCDQLLAVAIEGYPNSPPRPGEVDVGYYLLRRSASGVWGEIAEATGPSTNFNNAVWSDCCGGAGGGPDQVPEALIAGYNGPYLARLQAGGDSLIGAAPLPLAGAEDGGNDRSSASWIDLDGDDDLDAVVGDPAVLFYRNVGGSFTIEPPLVAGVHRVAVGSWDDDPEDELAVVGPSGISVRDRGTGDWSGSVQVDDDAATTVMWCDLRGDAHPELVVVAAAEVYIYPNVGTASAGNWLDAASRIYAGDGGYNDLPMVCGDLDGDGLDDLLYGAHDGWYRFAHGASSRQPLGLTDDVVAVALGDSDGDGRLDLFASMLAAQQVVVHLNQSTGVGDFSFGAGTLVFAVPLDPPRGLAWTTVAPGLLR